MKIRSNLTRILIGAVVSFSIILASCKKENSSAGTPAEQEEFANAASESDAEAEVVFDDIFDNVIGVDTEVGIGGTGVFGAANRSFDPEQEILAQSYQVDSTTPCFSVKATHLTAASVFPIKVIIDFGTGCIGRDGRIRKGKIISVYTNRLLVPGASATTTLDGYYVNGIKVEGTHKILNTSSLSNRNFKITISGARLSSPNGNFSQWNSEKILEQFEGLGTPFVALDDAFSITGAANGSVKVGDKFFQWATQIAEPIVKKFSCRWLIQGAIAVRKSNLPVATLEYGQGNCDNKATLTVNGRTREITLH